MTGTSKKVDQFPLQDFLIRQGGNSSSIYKLKPTNQLAIEEQLLCAMLRNDRELSLALINKHDVKQWQPRLLHLVERNGLASAICESVYELRLNDTISDLLQQLRELSSVELVGFERFDAQFLRFLDHISASQSKTIWYKGIALARSVYGDRLRLSGDFDFIVQIDQLPGLLQALQSCGYEPVLNDTGFCNQLGVGPTNKIEQLFLVPASDFVPSAAIGLSKATWPVIDMKFNPLDRGIKMVELDRFFSECLPIKWKNRIFLAPGHIDHLMICLVHFEKDRFQGWKWLVDIDMLIDQVNKIPQGWTEFVRRVKLEGVQPAVWGGLTLAVERLGSAVPSSVLSEITPLHTGAFGKLALFTVTPLFYWNTSSLPVLLINALVMDDSTRKLKLLVQSALPSKQFLSDYYWQSGQLNAATFLLCLFIHWLVICLPGGVVRHTFGRVLWADQKLDLNEPIK
ncbi:MAG TPA: nucleotidyltransferase family protein [Chroococcales cyanobacterium]